jgi:hypothetical protein
LTRMTHITAQGAQAVDQPPEERLLAHLRREAHPRPAAVLEPAAEEVARRRRLPGEREGAHLAPVHLQVLAGQPLEAHRHVRHRLGLAQLLPHPARVGPEVAAAARVGTLRVGPGQLQHAHPRQPLPDPRLQPGPVGVEPRAPPAAGRGAVDRLLEHPRHRRAAVPQRAGDLPLAPPALGQEVDRAPLHLPQHPFCSGLPRGTVAVAAPASWPTSIPAPGPLLRLRAAFGDAQSGSGLVHPEGCPVGRQPWYRRRRGRCASRRSCPT